MRREKERNRESEKEKMADDFVTGLDHNVLRKMSREGQGTNKTCEKNQKRGKKRSLFAYVYTTISVTRERKKVTKK